ncbi:cytidylyltransferase domain-containing protein [Pseudomonadota bacterium]
MSNHKYKYVAEIPARMNSNRVKKKNIRLLNGKPMIQYAIEACKKSTKVDEVFVNTDSDLIGQIAIDNGVNYYKRKEELASDVSKQDEFNYDFLKNTDCEAVVMVNPVSPLIESCDIDSAIAYFEDANLDSLVSTKKEQLHAFFQGNPLNFCTDSLLPATQDIMPVEICTWNICIWKKETFIKAYEKCGYAAFSGKVGCWSVDPMKAIKISYEEDFKMAEVILKSREGRPSDYKPEYLE